MDKHIAIIDPGMRVAEIDCFNNIVSMSPLKCTYHLPAMHGSESFNREDPEELSAIIIFGGSGNLKEPLEWRLKLESWFEKCLEKKVPVMAFCWGHQWIAHLFGGRVGLVPNVNKKLQGFREIRVEQCRLFQESSSGKVAVAHRSMVLEPPKRVNCFVKSDVIENEGFEYDDYPIYSFQSHPEATMDYMKNNSFEIDGSEDFSYGHGLVQSFINKYSI